VTANDHGAVLGRRRRALLATERVLLALGIALLVIYGAAKMHGAFFARAAILSFEASQRAVPLDQTGDPAPDVSRVNFSLWSKQRIAAYQQSLVQHFDSPLGLLRVPKIQLEVPVLEGTDDMTLNRGVGRIAGTARIGEKGNLGIAGHRDGFFRGLKDLGVGDRMNLVTVKGTDTYVVDKIQIVNPDDVSVLRPTAESSLTLVTCYPFYFVGGAPQRYIVHGSLVDSQQRIRNEGQQNNSAAKKLN
jgi:sortase A